MTRSNATAKPKISSSFSQLYKRRTEVCFRMLGAHCRIAAFALVAVRCPAYLSDNGSCSPPSSCRLLQGGAHLLPLCVAFIFAQHTWVLQRLCGPQLIIKSAARGVHRSPPVPSTLSVSELFSSSVPELAFDHATSMLLNRLEQVVRVQLQH